MEIRQVIAEDLEHLVRIENLGFSEEEAATREAFITRIQLIPDSFLVALIDGQVVGIHGDGSRESIALMRRENGFFECNE